jgi:hypothetical protein
MSSTRCGHSKAGRSHTSYTSISPQLGLTWRGVAGLTSAPVARRPSLSLSSSGRASAAASTVTNSTSHILVHPRFARPPRLRLHIPLRTHRNPLSRASSFRQHGGHQHGRPHAPQARRGQPRSGSSRCARVGLGKMPGVACSTALRVHRYCGIRGERYRRSSPGVLSPRPWFLSVPC